MANGTQIVLLLALFVRLSRSQQDDDEERVAIHTQVKYALRLTMAWPDFKVNVDALS